MHIYCDESGGTGRPDAVFLVAAIAIEHRVAERLVRQLRKTIKPVGEIKGYALSLPHRNLFFDLASSGGLRASVVSCTHRTLLGRWAIAALPGSRIYQALLLESCQHLLTTKQRFLRITCDDGRYKRPTLTMIQEAVKLSLSIRAEKITVEYGPSHDFAGIQIADLIANSVHQILCNHGNADISGLVREAQRAGWLSIRDVGLNDIRPEWLYVATE